MKVLMAFLVLIGITSAHSQKTYNKHLTKSEKKFVNCVLRYEKEQVISVVKRKDKRIVLEFPSTIYVLNPYGYIDDVWILGDGDWVRLGTEQDAY